FDALEVPRVRETLTDDARLQPDHGTPGGDGHRDLVGYEERHAPVASGQVAWLPATSAPAWQARASASSGARPRASEDRNTPSNASPAPVASTSSIGSAPALTSRPSAINVAPFPPRLTAAKRYRSPSTRAAPSPSVPVSTLASRSFASITSHVAVSSTNRSTPNVSRSGHDAASTAISGVRAPSIAAT